MREHGGYCLFDTAFGRAGVAWSDLGITALQFPEATVTRTVERLHAHAPGAIVEATPPAAVAAAVEKIRRHLEHGREDLTGVELDMRAVPAFHRAIYDRARRLPVGTTTSYGALAAALGNPAHARAVGQAMAKNPFVIVVPCHRVMGAKNTAGGFSTHGGLRTKARLLAREGAPLPDELLSLVARIGEDTFDARRALASLSARDPALGRLIARVGDFALARSHTESTYLSLARAVVYQQLTGKAAATIFGRVVALGGGERFPEPGALLALPDGSLRGAGLSASKVAALRDLATKVRAGAVPTLEEMASMDEEEIVERLTAVRGIGRWSAEMLMMFTLGRPDVLPIGDYGVRNGVRLTYGLLEMPTPEEVEKRGARWRPWRTVASWYLWRSVDLARAEGA